MPQHDQSVQDLRKRALPEFVSGLLIRRLPAIDDAERTSDNRSQCQINMCLVAFGCRFHGTEGNHT